MIKANNGPNKILGKYICFKPIIIVVTSFIELKDIIRAFFTFYLDFSTVPLQLPLFMFLLLITFVFLMPLVGISYIL